MSDKEDCGHDFITRYTTAGRFAPPATYWSCSKCGCAFAPINAKEEASRMKKIVLEGGYRDGLKHIVSSTLNSIQVAYIPDHQSVRCDPSDEKPWTDIKTQIYHSTGDYDEGYEIFRP